MKFKYVGEKTDGERAFQEKTGIEWFPGDLKDVPDKDHSALMLQHPTVWEPVGAVSLADAKVPAAPLVNVGYVSDEDVLDEAERREKAAREAKQVPAAIEQAAKQITDEDAGAALAAMDDAAVRAFAKAQSLKIQGIGLFKGDNLRAKVREALKG